MKKTMYLIVFMLVGMMSMNAQGMFKQNGLYYNITSNVSPYTVELAPPTSYYPYWNNVDKPTGDISIPATVVHDGKTYRVTGIEEGAFFKCTGVTSIEIPNSVTSIGREAFFECTGLASVSIPNSVISIEKMAFEYCSGLTSIEIPNSVTSIGNRAFYKCTGLTSVEISSGLTSIGQAVFYGCSGLTSIKIPYGITSIELAAFRACSGLTSIEIPNSVTSIGESAFANCSSLTSIEIPNSVTSIGYMTFNKCTNLAEITSHITEPSNVSLEGYVFYNVDKNTCVLNVPEGSKEKYKAAEQWKEFNSIKEPLKINGLYYKITSDVEPYTAELTSQITNDPYSYWNDADKPIGDISIPATIVDNGKTYRVTSIRRCAFWECKGITSIEIPNSVTSIAGGTFIGCSGITSIEIPNSVTSIEPLTFLACTGLTSIEIPNSVTSIGIGAFEDCTSLATITSRIIEPANVSLGADVFKNVDKNTCVLSVPEGSKEKYEAAEQWKEFSQISLLDVKSNVLTTSIVVYPNPIVDVLHIQSADTSIKQVSIYDITGKLLKNTKEILIDFSAYPSGLYFIEIETLGGKITKKLLKQ